MKYVQSAILGFLIFLLSVGVSMMAAVVNSPSLLPAVGEEALKAFMVYKVGRYKILPIISAFGIYELIFNKGLVWVIAEKSGDVSSYFGVENVNALAIIAFCSFPMHLSTAYCYRLMNNLKISFIVCLIVHFSFNISTDLFFQELVSGWRIAVFFLLIWIIIAFTFAYLNTKRFCVSFGRDD